MAQEQPTRQQQQTRLGAMLEHVTTWVEPFDDARSYWTFQFDGRPDLTSAYAVTVIDRPSDHLGPYYVVEVPYTTDADKPHGWPLTRLDYTIRDHNVLVSDAVYADRLVDMWRQLALKALQALLTIPPQSD